MRRTVLLFNGDGTTRLAEEPLEEPKKGEVRVTTLASLISAGTERLVLNGNIDASLTDTTAGGSSFSYPRTYGYCCVGRVTGRGPGVPAATVGKRVFGFLPHATHHTVSADALYELPDSTETHDATFIPNVETALSIVWDARIGPGARVILIGVGLVGTLVARMLQQIPALDLLAVDHPAPLDSHPHLGDTVRRCTSDAFSSDVLPDAWTNGPDVIIELSGVPDMMQRALDASGQETRVVLGSWYGTKSVTLDLGATFHRKRLTIAATPVSTIPARRRTRWSKPRQLQTAIQLSETLAPSNDSVDRVSFREAPSVYAQLQSSSFANPTILTYNK